MDFGYELIEKIGPGHKVTHGRVVRKNCKKNQIAEVLHDGFRWFYRVEPCEFKAFVAWVEEVFGEIDEALETNKTVWVK